MVVELEDEEQIRPLAEVAGDVCVKKDLTGPTLLEISGNPTQIRPLALQKSQRGGFRISELVVMLASLSSYMT